MYHVIDVADPFVFDLIFLVVGGLAFLVTGGIFTRLQKAKHNPLVVILNNTGIIMDNVTKIKKNNSCQYILLNTIINTIKRFCILLLCKNDK